MKLTEIERFEITETVKTIENRRGHISLIQQLLALYVKGLKDISSNLIYKLKELRKNNRSLLEVETIKLIKKVINPALNV